MKLPSQKAVFLKTLEVHQAIYERSGGLVGHRLLAGMPTLLLRTTGRKSGLIRTTALVYGRDGDDYLVCGSNGGAPKSPHWVLNLEADPDVEIQIGVRKRKATATALRPDHPDYERLFAICNKANRGTFAEYRTRTTRPLPVVVLTPQS
jgi:deazaflavin-dependent oxidoreductase (nitroreductase family)